MTPTIDPSLLALAGVGLAGAPPPPRRGWDRHLETVAEHGLTGLLVLAYERDLVDLTMGSRQWLEARMQTGAIRTVQLEGELIRLETTLRELDAVILKGAVLAHGAYEEPWLRPFTDLDVLVRDDRHDDAVRAFESHGYRRSRPEPVPGYDATVGKALTLVHPGGVVIDLHRTLVAGVRGLAIDVPELVRDRRAVLVNGRPVPAPSWDAHLVEVCLHAVAGDGLRRAISIRDIAEIARHPDLRPEHAVELAVRWNVESIVATGLRTAIDGFHLELPDPLTELASKAEPPPSPITSVRSARSRIAELRGGGLRRRLTVTRSFLVPSRRFLRFSEGEGSAPRLYLRRWRTLYRRGREARPEPAPRPKPGRLPRVTPDFAPGGRAAMRADQAPSAPLLLVTRRPLVEPAAAPLRIPPPVVSSGRAAGAIAARSRPEVGVTAIARQQPLVTTERPAAIAPVPARQERWHAARPPRAEPSRRSPAPPSPPEPPAAGGEPVPAGDGEPVRATAPLPEPGTPMLVAGVVALLLLFGAARAGINSAGLVLVPVAGLCFSLAMSRHLARRRPEEAWVGRWLTVGVVVKIAASYARFLTLTIGYEGVGDATGYDKFGRKFVAAWTGNGVEPYLQDLRKTNFLRWFTGVVYYLFGTDMIAGFFIFGLFALVGSYLWYRAAADSIPFLDRRLCLAFLFFAPSIAFWPSSIGKESLMQLGIGATALATSYFLQQRLMAGLLVGAAGGWLLWVVRPHLLALVTVAAGFAYLVGRVRPQKAETGRLGMRTLGLIVIAFLVAFTVGQGAQFLGMKDLSLSSVEQQLQENQTQSSEGGSSFDNGGDYLSPVNLPRGFATVLLRPFPWETHSPFQLLASLETAALAILLFVRFSSLRTVFTRARGTPFLMYCLVLTILYAATFASFANFGLLVRQRSLVLPALFVLIAVRPLHSERRDLEPWRPSRADQPGRANTTA